MNKQYTPTMPNGHPAPFVLTGEETVYLLRLDEDSGLRTLKYYRDTGQLCGIKIGRRMRYSLDEVVRFIGQKTSDSRGTGLMGQSSYNSKHSNNNDLRVCDSG